MEISIVDYDGISGVGAGVGALASAIETRTSGLRKNDFPNSDLPTWIGRVDGIEEIDLGIWQSRNNALAKLGLDQGNIRRSITAVKSLYGSERVGIVIGSSTSSIDRTEAGYADFDSEGMLKPEYLQPKVHNPHAPGLFLAEETRILGPTMTINTACSSSAKVFATAARWMEMGLIDAALVGGVDSLCLSVLHGFHSLQLVSEQPCRPYDQARDGINLGEAAGFAVLLRSSDSAVKDFPQQNIRLAGYGESSDAYHMSHPHPEGLGARLSVEQALVGACLHTDDIDYINLHGTASRANDQIEGLVVGSMFPQSTVCSSTKGWTGHTLGAAGIVEAMICMNALQTGIAPGNLNLNALDDTLDLNIRAENTSMDMHHAMSNSFGFGGNNCSLIFSRC